MFIVPESITQKDIMIQEQIISKAHLEHYALLHTHTHTQMCVFPHSDSCQRVETDSSH